MKLSNTLLPLLTACATLASCSNGFRRPESIEAKMSRFEPRNKNPNSVPKISVLPVKIQVMKNSRGPASVGSNAKNENEAQGLSNKRLYFLGLYNQYKELGTFISDEKTPEINHCPAFHSTLLTLKERRRTNGEPKKQNIDFSTRYSANSLNDQSLALYPELSLPLTLNDETITLRDAIKSEGHRETHHLLGQAIKVHLTKTYKELEELCDSGTSHNYYNYENLTTHIQRAGQEFGPTTQSLKSLLKTTLFANKAILESLHYGNSKSSGRFPASASKENANYAYDGVVKNLGANWTRGYFQALKKIRK